MTPEEYRAKWGLPKDYPMVAPGYAAQRSALAKATGLGSQRKKPASVEPEPTPVVKVAAKRAEKDDAIVATPGEEVPAKRRGRPKKAA